MSSRPGFWVRVSVRVCALAQLGGQGSGCWEVAGFHPRGVQGRSLAKNRAPHSDQPSHQRLSITDDRMPKSRPSLQAGETTQNAYPKNRRSGMPFSSRKGSESASRISISSPRGLPCLCAHSVVSVWPHGLQPARPGSSVHGIFQARILERVAVSFSRGSSHARDQTRVSCVSRVGRRILYR